MLYYTHTSFIQNQMMNSEERKLHSWFVVVWSLDWDLHPLSKHWDLSFSFFSIYRIHKILVYTVNISLLKLYKHDQKLNLISASVTCRLYLLLMSNLSSVQWVSAELSSSFLDFFLYENISELYFSHQSSYIYTCNKLLQPFELLHIFYFQYTDD